MRSRLAVLMVADLVDYSRIMSDDEVRAISAICDLKDKYLEPSAREHGGEILKRMGDGWIIAFSSVPALVQCATEVQTKLAGHPVIKLRIGGHIGEIVEDETDFYGAGVNLAQRLQTEAPPGGLMVSQDLYRQLTGELSRAFRDAGSFKLKNIALPVTGFQWRPQSSNSPGASDVPTIAVEPFEYAPDDSDTRAAAADLRDQLILRLSRRTGIRLLDEGAGRPKESTYLLRGRLRISGGRGRLNLALVLRNEGRTVLSQIYEGDTSDIFQFCDDLIERADADLRLQINAFDGNRIVSLQDDELSVSELRSRAAASFYKGTVESWQYARQLLDRALRLNHMDPMALAMRAEATVLLVAAQYKKLTEQQLKSLEADLNKAIELSPRSDYVFYARGLFRVYAMRDFPGAFRDVERTLSLSPAYPPGFELLGSVHLLAGEFDEAARHLEKAVFLSETDPLLPSRLFLLTVGFYCAERPNEAIETIDRAIQLRPNERCFHVLRAMSCRKSGDDISARDSETLASKLPKEPSILSAQPPLPATHTDLVAALSPN